MFFCNNGGADRQLQRDTGSDEDSSEAADDRTLSSVLLRIRQAYSATHGDHRVNYQVPEFARRLQEFELSDVTGDEGTRSILEHAQNDDFQKDCVAPEVRMQKYADRVTVNYGGVGGHGHHPISGVFGAVGRPTRFCGLIVPPFLRPIEEETNPDADGYPVTPDATSSYPAVAEQRGRHCTQEETRFSSLSREQQKQKREEEADDENEDDEQDEEEEEDEQQYMQQDTVSYWAFDGNWYGSGESRTRWIDFEEWREPEYERLQATSAFYRQQRERQSGQKLLPSRDSTNTDPAKDPVSDVDCSLASQPDIYRCHDPLTKCKTAEDTRTCSDDMDGQGRRSSEGLPNASSILTQSLSSDAPMKTTPPGTPSILSSQSAPALDSGGTLPVNCACPRKQPSVVVEWLDWTGLFFLLLTSGSTFVACLTSMPPSCLVAFISFASFISFPLQCHQ